MSATNLVRPSRDGDQFHYHWAARRCLLLLHPNSDLKAVTIEGSSPSEASTSDPISSGEDLIDVAEYYGSETLVGATRILYIQVKHSTVMVQNPWTPSELQKTLTGFAERYKALILRYPDLALDGKLVFWFVSNRPINVVFLEAVRRAADDVPTNSQKNLTKLKKFTGLTDSGLAGFCKLLRLEGNHEGLWDQRNVLSHEVQGYLADADVDAPVLLKELVTRKALSENAQNPTITRHDVLRALKTDESRLFPAHCLIETVTQTVERSQETEICEAIARSRVPVIVHAAGGVGKSIFATRINSGLPVGSVSILYDCFGNGQYRSASRYRHRHKDALVQISNELASLGLCHPLIASGISDPSAYSKAFVHRLRQSTVSLSSRNSQALLCVVIDAADNAQMAAEEIGETRAFVRDLIREVPPEGVRLVFLCRTHRQDLLTPPPNTLRLELSPFNRSETEAYLRHKFVDASEQEVDEFHRLSSCNPRVQALALSKKTTLSEILRALGPNPTSVEKTIGTFLDTSVANLRDAVGSIEGAQIDTLCAGLAALRPLIPISVLAAMSGVSEAAIKSFAFDIGRPLLVSGETIQFFDEPAETWFRERFKPNADELTIFIDRLKPLASGSAYVAAALPQLMLEAGRLTELVALALSSDGLPTTSLVEKRDVELQRLHFALKASLRNKRYTDAAKLALKAGGETAGDARLRKLIQSNTDLASALMESERIQEFVSRRSFGSGWVGSHHAYEAGLLSGRPELLGDASSRLRMANEWLRNLGQLPKEARDGEEVSYEDIVELSTAVFNIHGAERCARDLRRWQPREVAFHVGTRLARRFIDHGRYDDIDILALAARNDIGLVLGIASELREVHRIPPNAAVERIFRLISIPSIDLANDRVDTDGLTINAVAALVEAAVQQSIGTKEAQISLLTRYLPETPPRGLSSRFSTLRFPILRAYALRAALSAESLTLLDLAHCDLRKEIEAKKPHSESQELREFKINVGALLPWHKLWAQVSIEPKPVIDIAIEIEKAKSESSKAGSGGYREDSHTSDEIARVWVRSFDC
jgi:hypothetical protein